MKRASLVLLVITALTPGRLLADTHFLQSTDIGAMHFESETWLNDAQMRCRSVEPTTVVEFIVDAADQTFTLADESELEYMTMKYKLDKQGPGVAKLRQKAGQLTVRDTGAVETIGAWTAHEYRVEQAKSFAVSVWVAREAENDRTTTCAVRRSS